MGNPYKILLSILLSILIKLHGKSHAKFPMQNLVIAWQCHNLWAQQRTTPCRGLDHVLSRACKHSDIFFCVGPWEKNSLLQKKCDHTKKKLCLHKIWKSMSSDISIYSCWIQQSSDVWSCPILEKPPNAGGPRNRITGWVVFNGVFVGYWSPFIHGPMLTQERVMTSRLGLIGCPKIMWCFINIVRQPQLIANTPIESLYPLYPQVNLA